MEECIFCEIINGESNATIVYSDEEIVAFNDIDPQAPVHILVTPRKHIRTVADLTEEDEKTVGKMVLVANELAKKNNINQGGFRLVFNCKKDAGQEVYHLHLHLLGGRRMSWPPG
jgi:histidine triad (HIT) family protein